MQPDLWSELVDWRRRLHEGRQPPDIEAVLPDVEKVLDAAITTVTPVRTGEVHFVWLAQTATRQYYLRVAVDSHPSFQGEVWAKSAAVAAGLPAPEAAGVVHADTSAGHLCIEVEQGLLGTGLQAALLDPELSPARAQAIGAEVGGFLARLHAIPVDGFGYLDADGRGEAGDRPWYDLMFPVEVEPESYVGPLPRDVVEATVRAFEICRRDYAGFSVRPQLVHGDIKAEHLLMSANDRIVGILDFEDVSGGDGAYDLGWFNLFWGERVPLSAVIGGYLGTDPQPADVSSLQRRAIMCQLQIGFGLARYYHRRKPGYPLSALMVQRVRESLDEISAG